MRLGTILLGCEMLTLCACNRPAQHSSDEQQPTNAISTNNVAVNKAGSPDDRTPLNEPKGPIDPKSVEAAGQMVQSYGGLIEQGRWTEANALWGDSALAMKFETDLAQLADVHLEIGNLGEPVTAGVTRKAVVKNRNRLNLHRRFRKPLLQFRFCCLERKVANEQLLQSVTHLQQPRRFFREIRQPLARPATPRALRRDGQ